MNAYFQNRTADRAIRDLQNQEQKQLLHTKSQWPKAIHLVLWPFALRNAVHLHNTLPTPDENQLQLEKFSSINVSTRLADNHTYSCPVNALQNALQGGSMTPKWNPCCQLGVKLVPSPFNAYNVYLVLNPLTGLVSPQFHITYNDFFEIIQYDRFSMNIPTTWQQLAGLINPMDIDPDNIG